MKKIHLIMPMGGGGTRFGNYGFELPKPLIELRGKPFFYWAAGCITQAIDVYDITFVVLKDHIDRFSIDKRIKEYYPDARIVVIPEVLNGAVLTCLEGVKEIKDDLPVLFEDCDHAFVSREFADFASAGEFEGVDAGLLTFESHNPAFSFVRFDEQGNVTGTVEKQAVSDRAICGAYYFGSADTFRKGTEGYLKNCAYKEFFVSGVYNELAGAKIRVFNLDRHISFGTPAEYEEAKNDTGLGELIR